MFILEHYIYTNKMLRLLIVLLLCMSSNWLYAQIGDQVKTIVIDPGHGGKDVGTHQGDLQEKAFTLEYGVQLKEALENSIPSVQVFLTRDDDQYLKLSERTQFANDLGADLFISLHCNHHDISSIHGTELYIMGLHKSAENLEVVMRENQALTLEDSEASNHHMDFIFSNLHQGGDLKESAELAQYINDAMQKGTKLKQRGVKQAGFYVLKSTTMPGTLLEMAYLSNEKDAQLLQDPKHKEEIVTSMVEGIKTYLLPPGFLLDASPLAYSFLIHKSDNNIPDPNLPWSKLPYYTIAKAGAEYHYMMLNYNSQSTREETLAYLKGLGFVNAEEIKFQRNTSSQSRNQSK